MTIARVLEKLTKLIEEGEQVAATATPASSKSASVDQGKFQEWAVNSITLIHSAFGPKSAHYAQMEPRARGFPVIENTSTVLSILRAAKRAWEDGLFFDVQTVARADVEADLIGQATTLLQAGYDRAAAVVAGAIVEERLRAVAPSWGVAVHDAKGKVFTMEPLNIEMKKAGAYDGIMQKRITLLGGLRNKAAHGEAFDNRAADVEGMIRDAVRICDEVTAM